jgi:hypothetical protein
MFVADAGDSPLGDDVVQARLEHAVARGALNAWSHGVGSADSVGQAYAALGDLLARESLTT